MREEAQRAAGQQLKCTCLAWLCAGGDRTARGKLACNVTVMYVLFSRNFQMRFDD